METTKYKINPFTKKLEQAQEKLKLLGEETKKCRALVKQYERDQQRWERDQIAREYLDLLETLSPEDKMKARKSVLEKLKNKQSPQSGDVPPPMGGLE